MRQEEQSPWQAARGGDVHGDTQVEAGLHPEVQSIGECARGAPRPSPQAGWIAQRHAGWIAG